MLWKSLHCSLSFCICSNPYLLTSKIPTVSSPSSASSPLPSNTLLATIDITCLYSNIPHTHGLSALESSYPEVLLPLALTHYEYSFYPLSNSCSLVKTSPLTHSITFRLRPQPWEPRWLPLMIISSWDPWRRTF